MDSQQNLAEVDSSSTTVELCCRVCLQLEDLMVHIYDGGVLEDLQSDLGTLLERCGGIKVEKSDSLPKFLCKECTSELLIAAKFREKCERAQQLLTYNVTDQKQKSTIDVEYTESDEFVSSQSWSEDNLVLSENQNTYLEIPREEIAEIKFETETLEDGILSCGETFTNLELTAKEDLIISLGVGADHKELKTEISLTQDDVQIAEVEQNFSHETAGQEYVCDSCGAMFMQTGNLRRHMEKVHQLIRPYLCTLCGHCFSLVESYKTHCKLCTHSSSIDSSAKNVSTTQSKHKTAGVNNRVCMYCNKKMQSVFALNMHLRTHTGERPYKCSICPKAFKTQSACSMHLKRHAGSPDYACSICQKAFYETSNLAAHMRTHTGEKPHACIFCQKRFSRVFLLNLHMRTHTGEKPYCCSVCNRGFAQLCDLKNHERIHTGERRHKCPVCAKTFIKRYTLMTHMGRHDLLQSDDDAMIKGGNVRIAQSPVPEVVVGESIQTSTSSNMLEENGYFLQNDENNYVDVSYDDIEDLVEHKEELSWSDLIVKVA